MGQEKVFRVKIDKENFFTGRDTTSGQVYGSPQLSAGLRATFDVAAAIAARLQEVGYDDAIPVDMSGRPVGPDNDRPASISSTELAELWGPAASQ
jgi:hypothetical protein